MLSGDPSSARNTEGGIWKASSYYTEVKFNKFKKGDLVRFLSPDVNIFSVAHHHIVPQFVEDVCALFLFKFLTTFHQYIQTFISNKLRLSAHREALQAYYSSGSTKPQAFVFNLGLSTKDGSDSYFAVIIKGMHSSSPPFFYALAPGNYLKLF